MPRAIRLSDLNALNEEIAVLAAARAPLEPHLRDVARQVHGRAAGLAERLGDRMARGESLADAVDAEGEALPAAYRAIVRAGVRSGRLPSALEAVVESSGRVDEFRNVAGISLIYPMLIVVFAWVMGCLAAFYVAPRFDWVDHRYFGSLRQLAESPAAAVAIAIGLPAIALAAAFIGWRRSSRAAWSHAPRRRTLLPFGAAVRRYSHWAVFAEVLRLLVSQRTPLGEALRIAADAAGDRALARDARLLADDVDRGRSALVVFRAGAGRALPPLVRIALAMADDPAIAERGLARAAEVYGERAARLSSEAADLLPIVATALLAAPAVLLFALSVFWPYVSAMHQMSSGLWN